MNVKKALPLVFSICSLYTIEHKVPLVFHPAYDISFFKIENIHPFDSKKYGKVARYLQNKFRLSPTQWYQPERITDQELLTVHTPSYLQSLKSSTVVAQIAEIPLLQFVPNFLLQRNMISSVRYATAGTILAAQLALKYGWAINLSGGYHHAKANEGGGFCFFADIPLAIQKLREQNPCLKVLVVDLDAHQGNGTSSILASDPLSFIFDMYSEYNYPYNKHASEEVDFYYPLQTHIQDQEYLDLLYHELPKAIYAAKPDLIIYNAGTDVFEKDPIGRMSITEQGIFQRDAFVFDQAFKNKIPICMVLSGGYTKESAGIISRSLEQILQRYNLVRLKQRDLSESQKEKSRPVHQKRWYQLFK